MIFHMGAMGDVAMPPICASALAAMRGGFSTQDILAAKCKAAGGEAFLQNAVAVAYIPKAMRPEEIAAQLLGTAQRPIIGKATVAPSLIQRALGASVNGGPAPAVNTSLATLPASFGGGVSMTQGQAEEAGPFGLPKKVFLQGGIAMVGAAIVGVVAKKMKKK